MDVPVAHSFEEASVADDVPPAGLALACAHSFADPSFLCAAVPIAHSLAEASVAVPEGVVANVAHCLAEPSVGALAPSSEAQDFADLSPDEPPVISAPVCEDQFKALPPVPAVVP